jgi:hypothetical protein
MVVRQYTEHGVFESFKREIAVQFDHGAASRYGVGAVNLNLVISLCVKEKAGAEEQESQPGGAPYRILHRSKISAYREEKAGRVNGK